MTDNGLFDDEYARKEMTITIRLYGAEDDRVQVTVTDDEGETRTEEFTDEMQVMGVYTLMDLLLDVMEGQLQMGIMEL